VDDHVADVVEVASALDRPPVLIGHSMGGFVVQHYLASDHPAAGAVLVAPVPRAGAWGATLKTVGHHPGKFAKANLILDIGPIVETPELAHEILFGSGVGREKSDKFFDRWECASYRTYLDLLLKRPRPLVGGTPMLVVGGDHDWLFDVSEWERTAADHGARMVVIEGAGHQVMLEPGWVRLVELIDGFVGEINNA
jgi:pimeloyl-ACP methyl ester carboxylesterase